MRATLSILLILVAASFFHIAGRLQHRLPNPRPTSSHAPLEDAPPLVAFTTVALGGFRGVLADILWLRISYKQDEGEYFELVQLADWITKLEPHSSEIWGFHAWNLAYNISVMFPDPENRWRWVQHGIELLRDQGLVYNPGDPKLYTELGWLFQHKIGSPTDDAHRVYKTKWSTHMLDILGAPYPDYPRIRADPDRMDRLTTTFKLDPATMQAIDARYGPQNWICPETHALYWAFRARAVAPGGIFLPADRMIYQSLATLFRYGARAWWLEAPPVRPAPDPARLPGVLRAYQEALATYEDETVVNAYREFLYRATLLLLQHGHHEPARDLYGRLRAAVPDANLPVDLDVFARQAREADGATGP